MESSNNKKLQSGLSSKSIIGGDAIMKLGVIIPYLFAWFLLKLRYSVLARLAGFCWLAVLIASSASLFQVSVSSANAQTILPSGIVGQATTVKIMPSSKWTYANFVDRMSGEQHERYASLQSDNVPDLKFPYNGGGPVTLIVYNDKSRGFTAELRLSKGLYDRGNPRVKFDNGKVVDLISDLGCTVGLGTDTKFLFTRGCPRKGPDFFDLLKVSNHLKLELYLVGNSPQILEFSLSGLDPSILIESKKSIKKRDKP